MNRNELLMDTGGDTQISVHKYYDVFLFHIKYDNYLNY